MTNGGNTLQVDVTVDDPGAFNMPWSAVQRWRLRLGEGGLRVGIAWQGKPGTMIDLGRSFPLASFAPLSRIPGVRLISLQKNEGVEQEWPASFPD